MDGQGRLRPRWTFGQIVLLALAAVPFAASIGFRAVDRTPPPVKDTTKRPSLVFDQYFVDLTEIYNSPRAEAYFRFRNAGQHPARILSIEPSCGCLKPRLAKRDYAPGEVCEFSMSVFTTHQTAGLHEYTLTIGYQDPEPHTVTIGFKVVLRQDVKLDPSQLIFIQSGTEATEEKVVVTDMRPHPFRVTGATCQSPLVKTKVGEPVACTEGGRDTSVWITVAANVPPAGVDTAVYLTTDDPLYPRIPIPLLIRDFHVKKIEPVRQPAAGSPQSAPSPPQAASSPRQGAH
jgi:Protein of unknown function (DUF1573)